MVNQVKCRKCGELVDKSIAVQYEKDKRYYHEDCLKETIKQREEKLEKQYNKKYTCPACNCRVDEDDPDKIEHNTIYYHNYCFKEKRSEVDERKELIDYIDKLLKQYGLTWNPMMFNQIKYYHDSSEYKFRYKGMEWTLFYYYEVLGNPFDHESLGIIPYYYEDAKRLFIQQKESGKSFREANAPIFTDKIVVIKPQELEVRNQLEDIDIASLLEDDE